MPARGEVLLTQLSKLNRKIRELESEEKTLTAEMENLDKDEFARLKESALSDEKPDLSDIKGRKVEIQSRLDEIEKEIRAKKDKSGDLSEDYGVWDHKRLSRLFEKQTIAVVEKRKARDAAEDALDKAEKELNIVTNTRNTTRRGIHRYEHGDETGRGKLKKFRDMEPTEAERAEKQHRIQSERFFKERDNAIFKCMEDNPPGDVPDKSRLLNLPPTLALYEKWHPYGWTFKVGGEEEVRPPERPSLR